jgi:cobalt/nickel transport system permease protein
VLGLVGFLLVVGLTPNHRLDVLAGWCVLACVAAALAFVDWRAVAGRLVLDLPIVALAATQALFGHGPHVQVLGLSLSQPGLEVGAALLAKATTGIVATSAVAACTTVPETLDALRKLGFPEWFCRMIALAVRQVDLLRAELERIRLATALRHPGGGRRAAWAVTARSLGHQLLRSAERAERVQLAARIRAGGDP